MSINWDEIKLDYIANNMSLRKLAEKYGINKDVINYHSKKENWLAERKKLKMEIQTKARQKLSTKRASVLVKELIAAEEACAALINIASEVLKDQNQFTKHIVKLRTGYGMGKFKEELVEEDMTVIDAKRFKDLAAGLEIAARLSRTLKGIIDEPVKQKLDIEREKLEIERTKADSKVPPKDGITVIMEGDLEDWSE